MIKSTIGDSPRRREDARFVTGSGAYLDDLKFERLARAGSPSAYRFPKAIARKTALEFSFSGLKTSLRYQLEKMTPAEIAARQADLCASYQHAVIEALARKTRQALEGGAYRSLGLSGGVANNLLLQAELEQIARHRNVPFLRALPQHTGDNAGMIGFAAWADTEAGGVAADGYALEISPSLPLAR